MNDVWLIYAVAVSGKLSVGLTMFGAFSLFVSLFLFATGVAEKVEECRKAFRWMAPFSFTVFLAGLLSPEPKDIAYAYAIVEGSKVVNADNAEKVAKDFSTKFDKLLEAVSK